MKLNCNDIVKLSKGTDDVYSEPINDKEVLNFVILDNYKALAVAIVYRSIIDYTKILRQEIIAKRLTVSDKYEKWRIERFFNSKWCDALIQDSDIRLDYILTRIKKEMEESSES